MTQAVRDTLTPEGIAAINATTRQFTTLVIAGKLDAASHRRRSASAPSGLRD
jgi:hypothetical protein